MRFFLTIIFFISFLSPVLSQRKVKLNTHGKGTLFGQFGYNRSGYTSPTINVSGTNYEYSLIKVITRDNQEGKKMGSFFSDSSPQFSARLGYFVADNWAITAGWDRYNTFFAPGQSVALEGDFSSLSNSQFEGIVNEIVNLDDGNFNLQQRQGINYVSIGAQRNDMLGRTKNAEFALQILYGIRFGGLFTKIDYSYDGQTTKDVTSLSGFGISADFGFRFDFYQHVYLQLGISGGWLNQGKMKLSKNEQISAKQSMGFFSPTLSLGFSIFANSKNNCATCPQW